MGRTPDDRFRIFVSHKHSDAKLAKVVQDQLEALSPTFECWVSGEDISSGSDWGKAITVALSRSHLLLLLFTAPSSNWDWCLYEAGLFIQFANAADEDVRSVVSLFDPSGAGPRPLASVQGVPAQPESIAKFLRRLCNEPWEVSDEWRRGSIASEIEAEKIESAAGVIADAFGEALDAYKPAPSDEVYFPCHRIVLEADSNGSLVGIPDDANVKVGEGATSGFTLSLFGLAPGDSPHTWSDLVGRVDGKDAEWIRELDAAVAASARTELFTPGESLMRAWDQEGRGRQYHPLLYSIATRPVGDGKRTEIVVVLDPHPADASVSHAGFN